MNMKFLKQFFAVLKKAFHEFVQDDAIKLSASLSYYTVFSIGPLLVIIISLSGIFFGQAAVEGKIYGQLKGLIGSTASLQVEDIIRNIRQSQHTVAGAIIGFIILLLGATGVFTEIQGSINYIWSIKAKPKKGWLKLVVNRLLSFSLVVGLSFVLMVSLTVNALMDLLNDNLKRYFANVTVHVLYVFNLLLILAVITGLFAVVFKVLPDARIKWKDAFTGALFTAFLFLLGKVLIGVYLGNSRIGLTYGASASVIIILSWVYYSSIILFFGAEFTKVYTMRHGSGIVPNDTAVFIIKREAKEIAAVPHEV
ncbi:MAG TPA: YihY/virulence factor BrkB family protein [Chitinophagaceae bacterium]|nr:YihY/virulence factor BrkB family protein [Chitinophagaceae bacterium]